MFTRARSAVLGSVAVLAVAVVPAVQAALESALPARPAAVAASARPAVDTGFLSTMSPRDYTIELDRWGIRNDGTSAIETTDRMQAAIDWASQHGYGTVRIPKGTYLLGKQLTSDSVEGLRLPSDMTVRMATGTVLRIVPNSSWNYCLLTISARRNVQVVGGVLVGDRDTHTYTPRASDGSTAHDEGHGICVWNQSSSVVIDGLVMRDFTGDGVLVHGGGTSASMLTRDVVVRNSEIYRCRRQGVSVVRGQRVVVENNDIHDISGVAPQFGIDLETPKGQGRSSDVLIRGNRFRNNAGGHVVNFDATNVWIDSNTMSQDAGKAQVDGPVILHKTGDATVVGNQITMTDRTVNGLVGVLTYSDGVPLTSGPPTTVSDNTCVSCGIFLRDLPPSSVERNTLTNGYVAVQRMNVQLNDNVVTQTVRYGYSFDKVTGAAAGNQLNGSLYPIPLSATAYTANWYS